MYSAAAMLSAATTILAVLALLVLQPGFTDATPLSAVDSKESETVVPVCANNITISLQGNDSMACLSGQISCLSLHYAFTQCTISNHSTFRIRKGTHVLNESLGTVYNTPFAMGLTDLGIVGDGTDDSIIDGLGSYGLAFVNVSRLSISDLTFLNCSQSRPSTSFTRRSQKNYYSQPFQVGVYIWRCQTVNISYTSIRESNAVGLVVYETTGVVSIAQSFFLNHVNLVSNESSSDSPGGGGINIEFPFCPPGHFKDSECGKNAEFVTQANYTISNCMFQNNVAHSVEDLQNQFILPNRSFHQAFGRGGGLAVYFSGESSNISMRISDSVFYNNQAIYGAGVFAEFHDKSHNNSLSVLDCFFVNNSCYNFDNMNGAGGGGMRLAFVFYDIEEQSVAGNKVLVSNSTFNGNKAYFGGGLSFLSGLEQNSLHATNKVLLADNRWVRNTARLGSAAYFTAFNSIKNGVRPVIELASNTFFDNSVMYSSKTYHSYLAGSGTVYCYNMPLKLKEKNSFVSNTGTGLVVVGTHVHLFPQSTTVFSDNAASNGGAMAFYANGWLNIHPNTTVTFTNNTAHIRGGALYADMTGGNEILTSRDCFLRYSDWWQDADGWNTSLVFENNRARGDGGDIFVSSFYPCIWGGSYGEANTSLQMRQNVFTWKPFYYVDHNSSIGSGLSSIEWNGHRPYQLSIVPGQLFDFQEQLKMYNDLDRLTTSPMLASNLTLNSSNPGVVVAGDSVITINTLRVLSQTSTTGSKVSNGPIQLLSISDPPMAIVLNVTTLPCPPGAWLNALSENSLFACNCAPLGHTGHLTGVTCTGGNPKFDIHVVKGYWVGSIADYWVSVPCPMYFCNTTKAEFGRIKMDAEKITKEICADNREGEICGQCKKNYSIVVTSPTLHCEACPSSDSLALALFKWFLIQFGTTTITVGVILLCGIDVASGKFASFVFFCQVVSVLNIDACQCLNDVSRGVFKWYLALYSFWSLELGDYFFYVDLCLPSISNPILLSLIKYIPAFYPFALILLVAALARCHKKYFGWIDTNQQKRCHRFRKIAARLFSFLSQRTDAIHGIATCFVFSYCKLTYLSLFILTPAYISLPYNVKVEPGAASQGNWSTRAWYHGEWEYFGVSHIYYAIPALIIFLLFVILPLFALVSYPLLPDLLRRCNPKLGEKAENFYRKAAGEYLYHVLCIFQNRYKDNCRFFAMMWFLYRLALFFNYTFNSNWWSLLTVQIVMGTCFLFFHAVVQPYKERRYNIIDCCFFANIILLSAVTSQANQNEEVDGRLYAAIVFVMLSLPFLYLAIVCLHAIITKIVSFAKASRDRPLNGGEHRQLLDPNNLPDNGADIDHDDANQFRQELYQSIEGD